MNGHLHMSLTRLMATRIIPRQMYGIKAMPAGLYIVPFCQDPTSSKHVFTTSVDLERIESAQLVLKFDRRVPSNGNTITLVVRHWDTLSYADGTSKWLSKKGTV